MWPLAGAAWCWSVGVDLSRRLVSGELWELTAPLLPKFTSCPRGGGTAPVGERVVFTAVVYVLTSGCAWRYLPDFFGISPATAHPRFAVWTEAGLWRRLLRAVLGELGATGELDWSSAIVGAASVRAKGVRRPGRIRSIAVRRAAYCTWCRGPGSAAGRPGCARQPGIQADSRLSRGRKIERSIAWLFGYRCLTVGYE